MRAFGNRHIVTSRLILSLAGSANGMDDHYFEYIYVMNVEADEGESALLISLVEVSATLQSTRKKR